jgi:hypothetical protein
MPDLESFIISAKNQEDLKSGIIRKKKKKGEEEESEEEVTVGKQNGTRSRPGNNSYSASSSTFNKEELKEMVESDLKPKVYQDIKVVYPHKKH